MRYDDPRKSVRTMVLPEVRNIIDSVKPDVDVVKDYKTNIVPWLSPIIDLSGFYIYPTNGITEGLNYWMMEETRKIKTITGDYEWVPGSAHGEILYMTSPSSIDGELRSIPTNIPVALDIAYVSSGPKKYIELPNNVERVFFSLSKCFGLRNIRTGWYFTRRRDPLLHPLIYKAKYYNYYAHQIAESVIDNFDVDHVFNRLRDHQINSCNQLGLTPSSTVWLGISQDNKWAKYSRGETNRVCITQEISTSFNS